MKIHIDASRALDPQPTGVNVYAREIIAHMISSSDGSHEFILYAPYWFKGREDKVFPGLKATWKFLWWPPKFLWTQIRLALAWFFADKRDAVFFAPAHVAPLFTPRNTVVTIHDIAFEFLPEAFTARERMFARFMTRANAAIARRILVPSNDTRDGLITRIGVRSSKIFVVPFALPSHITEPSDEKNIARVRDEYNLHKPFILSIGRIEYKKGVDRLVRAFESVKRAGFEGELVLIGKPGAGYEKIARIIDGSLYKKDIRVLGYVEHEDIPGFYGAARVFALATRYEGFGFNFLEAMYRKLPAVGFDVGSVKEISGDAALLANNEREFGEMLLRALSDEAVRTELCARGIERVKMFTWEQTVSQTLDVLTKSSYKG